MKNIILVGAVSCGKTTLLQYINGKKLEYKKTQAREVIGTSIDTPGEYLEHRSFMQALTVTAVDCDLVVLVQDATAERFMFSPGHAAAFSCPAVGVVTKTDLATEKQIKNAEDLLTLAGATAIFRVSAFTGEGMDSLLSFIKA